MEKYPAWAKTLISEQIIKSSVKTCLFFCTLIMVLSCVKNEKSVEYIKAPFVGLDTLSTNDWWNRDENSITNLKVHRDSVIAFGIYTVYNNTLKLTAQLYPLYPNEAREVSLEIWEDDNWIEIQKVSLYDLGWSAHFRIENWNQLSDKKYRLRHGENANYEGLIRKLPDNKDQLVLASLSCNSKYGSKSRDNYVKNINYQNPDLVFFAGDQSYEHTEHTAAWILFGLQFREIFRNRPCITIPDDHDIGQPNLWGEGGRKSGAIDDDEAGYFYHPEYINMVQRCQTFHLPDPYDPTPVEQGIGVYYTRFQLGDIDFAILEDRKWKSGPKGNVVDTIGRLDHKEQPNYDPSSLDKPGLNLLGDRQIAFLESWSKDSSPAFKVVLSQTGFSGSVHLHGTKENRLYADLDANAWPQTGRNKALRIMKSANAIHIAGDQHLGVVYQNGIDTFDDGPWCFLSPAIVNNIYGRWWWPESEEKGLNGNSTLPWTGQYLDGFANKLTMHAYANREQGHNAEGYGIIKFDKIKKVITFECWPRGVNVADPSAQQFIGWPISITL